MGLFSLALRGGLHFDLENCSVNVTLDHTRDHIDHVGAGYTDTIYGVQ
jgi:hypothetical protein